MNPALPESTSQEEDVIARFSTSGRTGWSVVDVLPARDEGGRAVLPGSGTARERSAISAEGLQ